MNQLENRENFPEQTENLLLYRSWKNLRYEEVKSNIFCFCVAIIFSCMVAIVCDAGWLFAAICIPSSLIAIAGRPKKILQRHECELPLVTVSESGIEVNREIIPKITVFIPWENLSEIKVFSFFGQTYIGFVPHDFEYLVETNKSAESFLRAFNGGCVFRMKAAQNSGPKWPPFPVQNGPLLRKFLGSEIAYRVDMHS